MKIHPIPQNNRNITLRFPLPNPQNPRKKLLRLPHIFAKVLELPFHSDADVSVVETRGHFRFTVSDTDIPRDVVADTVDIHPGVTKVVVRSRGVVDVSLMEFELDLWRFRLPESTRPELAFAVFDDGDLVVVVPKNGEIGGGGGGWGGGNNRNGSNNSFVLVN